MKEITKTLLSLGLVASIATGLSAKVLDSVEVIEPEGSAKPYVEANATYGLPFEIGAYTFMDLSSATDDGSGSYFGKTFLTRDTGLYDIGVKVTLVHGGDMLSAGAVGLTKTLEVPDFGPLKYVGDISATFSPYWFDIKDWDLSREDTGKQTLGFATSLKLPLGYTIGGFGEIDTDHGKWTYGEIQLDGFKLGSASLSPSAQLVTADDLGPMPHVIPGLTAKWSF